MFGLFKKKAKKETELDFFNQFFHADYEHFVKIRFPIKVYTELPSEPKLRNHKKQQEYIIDNLIPEVFKHDFEKSYSNFEGSHFEIIEKHKSGDVNLSKRQELVFQCLENQPRRFLKASELEQSNSKIGNFNVFPQYLDETPLEIFKLTLDTIQSVFPDSFVTWRRIADQVYKLQLYVLLESIDAYIPLNYLDQLSDIDGNWELCSQKQAHSCCSERIQLAWLND